MLHDVVNQLNMSLFLHTLIVKFVHVFIFKIESIFRSLLFSVKRNIKFVFKGASTCLIFKGFIVKFCLLLFQSPRSLTYN